VIAFGTQELARRALGERGAPIVVAFVLGWAAYIYARRPGRVAFTIMVPGLLQLAPGFLGSNATFRMLTVGVNSPTASYFDVILLALQLGIGILLAGLLFKHRHRKPRLASAPAAP
jgi:uncharacterized membrane protein YjjB (DUF3815 family)